MRINSVPDVKCFCNNKNVLRAQSMVWHFVRHPVLLNAMCGQNTEFLALNLTVHIIYGVKFNSKAQESQIKCPKRHVTELSCPLWKQSEHCVNSSYECVVRLVKASCQMLLECTPRELHSLPLWPWWSYGPSLFKLNGWRFPPCKWKCFVMTLYLVTK